MGLEELLASKVRVSVSISLAKSSPYGVAVAPLRVIRVYGLNIPETYRFFRILEGMGIAVRVRGGYRLADTPRARRFGELVLDLVDDYRAGDGLDLLRTRVPDTMYYVVDTSRYFREWIGAARPIVVLDRRLRGRVSVPDALCVYASFRGREYRYDWRDRLSYALREQAYADAVSFDPSYASYFVDILWNIERLDLEKMLRLSGGEGRRRLGTLLAYYSMLTGRKIPLSTPLAGLVDEECAGEVVAVATLTPQLPVLEREADRLGAAGLQPSERLQVLRNLERVWHLVRLLKHLQDHFGDAMAFGGGAVLNYLFLAGLGEPPRFTFDIDAAWMGEARLKRVLLREFMMFNKRLAASGEHLELPVAAGRGIDLYVVEYDVEKDFFPDILSLRVPVVTRWSGEEFYRYVRRTTGLSMDYGLIRRLREVFADALGVEDARIDYVRLEVSIGRSYPTRRERVALPFGMGEADLNVTVPEYQLALKLALKLGKDYGGDVGAALPDLLKAVVDLRMLDYVDGSAVRGYVEEISGREFGEVAEAVGRNLDSLLERGRGYWLSHHYLLVRRSATLESLIRGIKRWLE